MNEPNIARDVLQSVCAEQRAKGALTVEAREVEDVAPLSDLELLKIDALAAAQGLTAEQWCTYAIRSDLGLAERLGMTFPVKGGIGRTG